MLFLPCYTSIVLSWRRSLQCVFILTSMYLNIWGIECLRDILERFSQHHFSLMYFKLHFLFWHGIHLKVGAGKASLPPCILVIRYEISSWFYGWLSISQREGDVLSAASRSKALVTACSPHVPCGLKKPALPRRQLWYWRSPYFVQSVLCSECI